MSQSVLIADDDASLRLLVTTTLADDSVTLLEAQDGLQALTLARQQRPNLILLDVAMPGLTGLEVCRALKADPETAHLRVIMLTAHGQAHDRQQGLAAGAEAYLTKPFSPLQLLNLVESSLRAAVWPPRETPKRFSAHMEKAKKGEDETLKHYNPVRLYP